jgi:cytochrome c556
MMVGLVDHASHVIWDAAVPETAPKSDADWHELEYHAMQLAAAGTVIQLGGTGKADPGWAQQTTWRTHADSLSDAGLAALEAARMKNTEGIATAGNQLVGTCESCHKEFKPDAPTEGILHPHE